MAGRHTLRWGLQPSWWMIPRGTAGACGAAGAGQVMDLASVFARRRTRRPPPVPVSPHHPPRRRERPCGPPHAPGRHPRTGGAAGRLRRDVCNHTVRLPAAVMAPSRELSVGVGEDTRGTHCGPPTMCSIRHTAGRTAVNCQNRRNRPAGNVAAFYAAMPSTTFRRLTGQVPTSDTTLRTCTSDTTLRTYQGVSRPGRSQRRIRGT
jgi:hypothetical protein